MYAKTIHECHQKFISLSFFFYGNTRVSIIPNYMKSSKIISNRLINSRHPFLFCEKPIVSAFSKLHRQKSHFGTMCEESGRRELNIHYEELLEAQKDNNVLIIDVREQPEINETGKLPGSIHIPMGDVSNILINLSEKDFKERYGKSKPTKDTKIIFSCRSGKRSGIVQAAMQAAGYTNAYNYIGGWLDWESKHRA